MIKRAHFVSLGLAIQRERTYCHNASLCRSIRCQLRVCNRSTTLDDCLAAGVVTGEDDLDELKGCEGGREEARSLLDFMDFEVPENETLWPERPLWSASLGLVHVNFFSDMPTLVVRGESMI